MDLSKQFLYINFIYGNVPVAITCAKRNIVKGGAKADDPRESDVFEFLTPLLPSDFGEEPYLFS